MGHSTIRDILSSFNVVYSCMADEIGKEGTYHTHLFVIFASPVRFSTIQHRFEVAHIDPAYGTAKQNRDYITKEGRYAGTEKESTKVEGTFEEIGELPSEKEEKYPQMVRVQHMIEGGTTTSEIIREFPNLSFRSNDIDTLRQTFLAEKYSKENRTIETVYIFGETGTGKTAGIYADNPAEEICRITNYANPRALFDAYHGQNIVVFEEYHSQIVLPEMLSYLDVYPLMLPARYSDRVACYSHVYITSNISLLQQYPDIQHDDPKTWAAFLRRIHTVRRYTDVGVYEDFKMEGGYIPI